LIRCRCGAAAVDFPIKERRDHHAACEVRDVRFHHRGCVGARERPADVARRISHVRPNAVRAAPHVKGKRLCAEEIKEKW
jgi:hypothetical protein